MKTKNNIQKTVKSQMKKVVLSASALIVSIVLLSWSVNAQDLLKQFLSEKNFGSVALLMNDQSNEFEKADAVADAIYSEINETKANTVESVTLEAEKELKVENWMTNETLFTGNFQITEETDKELKLENWMVNRTNSGNAMNSIQNETDQSLQVESWMINDSNFNSTITTADKDAELNLESWMCEDSIFTSRLTQQGNPLKLEAWMADDNFWGF